MHNIKGNTKSLSNRYIKSIDRLYERHFDRNEVVSYAVAKEMLDLASATRRMVGLIVSREGKVVEVVLGTKTILYLPDLGRYRIKGSRLRRLRLIVTIFPKDQESQLLTQDLITDLEKLRLDAVCGLAWQKGKIAMELATLQACKDNTSELLESIEVVRESFPDFSSYQSDFTNAIEEIERAVLASSASGYQESLRAIVVHVSSLPKAHITASTAEIVDLARSGGVEVVDVVTQNRKPDPKTVLGKGKLEEVVLNCLRYGIGIIIFDCELQPTQWRNITNATELKVLDRSMVILDVFAQRAQSNEGRLQVELAQLKYNLPRLSERDSGLSRLTGGIGGRGPGETKLELERRRSRSRINALEKRIEQLVVQRDVRESRRVETNVPLIALVGYTNAGKSTLFNKLTGASVLADNIMFATLDPTKRRMFLNAETGNGQPVEVVLCDTVGFIRDLPKELINAFRATLDDVRQATIILHIVDCAEDGVTGRIESVDKILKDMNLESQVPKIMVFNKVDQIDPVYHDYLRSLYSVNTVFVSSYKDIGLDRLKTAIYNSLPK